MARKATGIAFVISATAQGIEKATSKTMKGFEGMTHGVAEGFHFLHHAIRVAHEAIRIFKDTIGEVIKTSINYHSANDGVRETFDAFSKSIEIAKARLGDAFLPTLMGFVEVLRPVVDGLTKWLVANQKVIGSGIAEWTLGFARGLVSAVVPAVGLVGAAFYGWKMIFETVKVAWSSANLVFLKGIDAIVQAWAKWKNATGDQEGAIQLTQTHMVLKEMIDDTDSGLDKNINALGSTVDAYNQWKTTIAGVQTNLLGFLDRAQAGIDQKLKRSWTGSTMSVEEYSKAQDLARQKTELTARVGDEITKIGLALKPHVESFDELQANGQAAAVQLEGVRQKMIGISFAMQSATAEDIPGLAAQFQILSGQAGIAEGAVSKMLDAQKQRIEGLIQGYAQYGEQLGQVFGQIAAGTLRGADAAKAAARVALGAIREVAMHAIEAAAAKAAAEAYASQAGIPVVGPFLGVGAAAAAFAFVDQFLTKFATGGFVQGAGTRDTVPALLTPGEYVMSRDEVAHGRARWQGGGSRAVVMQVQVTQQNLAPDNDFAFARKVDAVVKAVQDAITSGRIRIPATALGSP